MLLAGCGHDAGVIFPSVQNAPQWPAAPGEPRIRYVGQLTGSKDLKPAVSGLQALGSAVFGTAATDLFISNSRWRYARTARIASLSPTRRTTSFTCWT